jgi:ATP-dependent Lhr-like helicase
MTKAEWRWCLQFITTGGHSLGAYDEYRKVEVIEGVYQVVSRRIALRHRLSIGAIVSDTTMRVKYLKGAFLGNIEEWFVAQLEPGDTFWFAGRSLKLVRVKDMTVYVRRSKAKKGRIPAWMGGRLQLSSRLGDLLRQQVAAAITRPQEPELRKLQPLLEVQQSRSIVPLEDELLIEYFKDREGYHLLVYPFEGYYVHEGLANLLAYRLGQRLPITFSIALNDYGFELLSDQHIPIHEALAEGLLSTENLTADIEAGINAGEVTKRRFRDIASIAGLIFRGYPGKQKKDRHLQASSQLFFEVFSDYEPDNLLLLQAYEEVRTFHFEEARLRAALERINRQTIRLQEPGKATPFSFPILIDRLRSRMSSEQLANRIARMKVQLVK